MRLGFSLKVNRKVMLFKGILLRNIMSTESWKMWLEDPS